MITRLQQKDTPDLFETPLVHQSSYWSQVKEKQGVESMAFDIKIRQRELTQKPSSAFLLDDILLLSVPINRDQRIVYAPYGPLFAPKEEQMGVFLEHLSESLRPRLGKETVLIRYDLPWIRPWDLEITNPASMEIRMNWGCDNKLLRKSPSDQLPVSTSVVSLLGTEEEILMRMKPKTRYNIRLAKRKGVEVTRGTCEDIETFYDLYTETARRNHITLHDISFFKALEGIRSDDAQCILLIAKLDNTPLSAMFLTKSENRATYLFGASSSLHRECMSTYALQWEAMRCAKQSGCTSYDLFGIAPDARVDHPMHGLYRFKKGFGGQTLNRLGCWDYLYDQETAQALSGYEMADRGYHNG